MDAGRYVLQRPGWDTNSGLERYGAVQDTEYRLGGAYRERNFAREAFPRESSYPREAFHRDILIERDHFQPGPPALGLWPAPRRRTLEEELAIIRGTQRHDKAYVDNLRKVGSYRDFDTARENESFRDRRDYRDMESYHGIGNFRDADRLRDYGYTKSNRVLPIDQERYEADDYISSHRAIQCSSKGSPDEDYGYFRHENYESDHEHGRRDRDGRVQRERDRERRDRSRDRERSPARDNKHRDRSRSRSHDGYGWRSQSRSRSRGKREGSDEGSCRELEYEKSDKKRDRDEKRHQERIPVAPSATVVVKGLSQKTVEDDLCQALIEWGPLRHVRVIKERNSGASRGFAFVDFPSVEAAQKMMDALGKEGLIIDGRRLLLEYSSKPTGGLGVPQVTLSRGSGPGTSRSSSVPLATVDWMCTVCGCVNFARRTSCFQCNEGKAEDAPVADASTLTPAPIGKKGSEAAPTHVLVVRGLDEHVDEETLHFEFSKYAPIKDLRLVRDKFTHVSRGFAFVHFHSVEDATKALEASNGTTLDKNGQVLRVAYAKSIHGPGSSSSNPAAFQNNSLAAAAIEAATFAHQYDMVGWAPKEYNPEAEREEPQQGMEYAATIGDGRHENTKLNAPEGSAAPQSGFVWDEASGYYYDATSGFYYDGHRGLYYDGNNGVWYTYDEQTQQYVPYIESTGCGTATDATTRSVVEKSSERLPEASLNSKAVIFSPPATIHESVEKKSTITKLAQPSAIVAQATTKKEKEVTKEKEKVGSKGILLASRKKMGNAVNLWKQRQHEAPATPIPSDEGSIAASKEATTKEEKAETFHVNVPKIIQPMVGSRKIEGVIHTKGSFSRTTLNAVNNCYISENPSKTVEKSSCTGLPVRGIIKGGVGIGDYAAFAQPSASEKSSLAVSLVKTTTESNLGTTLLKAKEHVSSMQTSSMLDSGLSSTLFKTDSLALGSYESTPGVRRRFTEAPQPKDRTAERRNRQDSSVQ